MATKQSMYMPKKATATIILVSLLLIVENRDSDHFSCVPSLQKWSLSLFSQLAPGSRFGKAPIDYFPVAEGDVKIVLAYGHVLDEFFWEVYDVGKELALRKFLQNLVPLAQHNKGAEFERRVFIFKELFYAELRRRDGSHEGRVKPLEAESNPFEVDGTRYILKLWLSGDGTLTILKVRLGREDFRSFDTAFHNAGELLDFAFLKSTDILARILAYFAKAQMQENPASTIRLIHPEAFLEEIARVITEAHPALSRDDARLLLIKSAQASIAIHDLLSLREFERILYLGGKMADDNVEYDPFFNQDILNRKVGHLRSAISAREFTKAILGEAIEPEIATLEREAMRLNEIIPKANRAKNDALKKHGIKVFEGDILNLWLVESIRNSIVQTLLEALRGPLVSQGVRVKHFPQLLLEQNGEHLTIKKVGALLADPDREIVVKPKLVDVKDVVRNLHGPSVCIEVERSGLTLPADKLTRSLRVIDQLFTDPTPDREDTKLDLDLPKGGLSAVDYLTIITRHVKGDSKGLKDFADELAECIAQGRWEDCRKRLWVFKEFFWEKLADTKEAMPKAEAFSDPFIGADGKAYKLRVRVFSNRLVEVALFNHESEVTIHGLKVLLRQSAFLDVSLEFLNRLTTFISADTIRNGLKNYKKFTVEALTILSSNEELMNGLDTMATSGARDFLEYAFENEPRVFMGVVMAFPFDLERQLQPTLSGIFGDIGAGKGAPSFHLKSSIILKAELAAIRMLDFRDMMISERSYLQGKVNPPSAAAINRRLRLLTILTGIEVPANIEGVMANDFPLVGLENIAPDKCNRGMIKLAHDQGENESVAFLLKEKDGLIRSFKEERSRLWKWQRAMKRITSAREGLLQKHSVKGFDASVKNRLSNSRFRRTLYAALEKLSLSSFEGAALLGFPHLRLHLERGELSVIVSDPYDDGGFTLNLTSAAAANKPQVIAYLSAFLKGEGGLNYTASALRRLMNESFVIFVNDLGIGASKSKDMAKLLEKLGIAAGCKSGACILIEKGDNDLTSIYERHISDKGARVPVIISDAANKESLLGSGKGIANKCLFVVVNPPDERVRSVVAYKVCRIVNAILNGTGLSQVKEIILTRDAQQLAWMGGNIDNLTLGAKELRVTPILTDRLYFDRVKLAASP